ncbi:MAG: formimidoylglutamate deiminase [Acidobacteriota bacterium]
MQQVLEADLTWTGDRFEPGMRIAVGDDGRILAAGALGVKPTLRLERQAILPGFVNAHSHAFQRGLRGKGELFSSGSGSFWSWREAMYGLVETLGDDALHALTVQAFREMRSAGITTVGEFHYLHHSLDPGAPPFRLDEVILAAAAEADIRLVLLNTFYRTGGIGRPLASAQARFNGRSLDHFLARMEQLTMAVTSPAQTLGLAAHSIRAVSLDEITVLHQWALERKLAFHMHVEEQQQEIDDCLAAYGERPLRLLNDRLEIGIGTTAVHCTHSDPVDLARFASAGGNVCITPLTEANLGDGLSNVEPLSGFRGALSLGTDSNARISMIEEMRWLEYGQRLRGQFRGAFRNEEGSVAATLLSIATAGGARSLGVEVGTIAVGQWADFVTIDLNAPVLAGWNPSSLVEAIVFGADNEVVRSTAVAGRWREHR